MNDQTCNRAYEKLAKGVADLNPGVVIDNGPTPLFGDVKARCDTLITREYHRWSRDDYTGFDEPIRRKLPADNKSSNGTTMRRVFTSGTRIMYNMAKTAATSDVISFTFDGHGSGYAKCVWMDDLYYADWYAYERQEWTKAREIDARLLTNEEVLALKILVEATTRELHGSTRCTPIIRCTVEQIFYLVADDNIKNRFHYVKPDFSQMGKLPDMVTDRFRRQAPADFVAASDRVLTLADAALAFVPKAVLDWYTQMRAHQQMASVQPKMRRIPSDDHGVPDTWVPED